MESNPNVERKIGLLNMPPEISFTGHPQGVSLHFIYRTPARGNTSHLRTSHWKRRCERIKQVDKIEELIFRIERFGWRHPAFLRFVLVIDLLDLPAVDPQPTWWQDVACHLVPQARKQRHDRLIWLHSEHERNHLGQFKESFTEAEL